MSCQWKRRRFLRDTLLLSAGVAAGTVGSWSRSGRILENRVFAAEESAGAEERLRQLGIELPPSPKPVAVYVPAVVSGNLLFASGHAARRDGKLIQGRVGSELTLKEGYQTARQTGIDMLSTVRATLGSLDRVVRLVKVTGMVNCTPDFTQQPEVINGFSELMVEVFGEKHGKGARSAVGMGSLPRNIPVEIEAIFEVRP